jgi:predicted  nucleic acid-binding Zn-ribbon protein
LKQELAEQAAELDAELAEGEAAQRLILQQERQIKGLYESYRSSQAAAAEAEDKADQLANSLGQATDQVQVQAAASRHLRAELERRAAAVESAQARVDSARVRLQLEAQQLGSMQQKVSGHPTE